MTRYSVQPRYQIFVKGYGFLSLAKIIGWNNGKRISKNVIRRYSQNRSDHTKQSTAAAL